MDQGSGATGRGRPVIGRERPAARLGRDGEGLAARHLEASGLRVLERGFRTRAGEIDIIAEEAGVLVFVEVKSRSGVAWGRPAEAVDGRKQARVLRAARVWLMRHEASERPCRFDVVEVLAAAAGAPRIHHIRDAYQAD